MQGTFPLQNKETQKVYILFFGVPHRADKRVQRCIQHRAAGAAEGLDLIAALHSSRLQKRSCFGGQPIIQCPHLAAQAGDCLLRRRVDALQRRHHRVADAVAGVKVGGVGLILHIVLPKGGTVCLGIGAGQAQAGAAVDAAAGNGMLRGIADGIKYLTSGVLKLILTLFTAYLAIAGGVSGNVDRMTLKTAKLAVSGAVPVVGGVISDATETMLSGAALLRGSIGIFGMLCVAAICFVPFVRAGASYLCYKAGAAVLSPLCSDGMKRFLENVGTGFGLLLGMLSTCCMILFLELVYMVAMVKPI